jgi:hypothetical protein
MRMLLILAAAGVYLGIGVLFGLGFVTAGVGRIDPAARGGSVGFRLMILPGTAALWPALALKLLRAGRRGGRADD